tara:strand:- start:6049 stop:7542 length:1494 start_codon:yes stop_codon:yes gene_type:complete
MELGNNERRMMKVMLNDSSRKWSLEDLLDATGWSDQVHIAGAGKSLYEAGLVEISEKNISKISLGAAGIDANQKGLLEARIWSWMQDIEEEERTMQNLFDSGFERHEAGPGVGLLKNLGVSIVKGVFVFDNYDSITNEINSRIKFISHLADNPTEKSLLDEGLIDHFKTRKNLISIEESTIRTWSLTREGSKFDVDMLSEIEQIGQITPELLQGDSWKEAEFKPFDVNAPTPTPAGGRPHPMQALIGRIRSVFLEMGFSEIEGDYVQSAGWNMDALYIPQSHPARTMQDTFYLSEPSKVEVEQKYLNMWTRVHEYGDDTGSKGWGVKFDTNEAQKALLRTHTTVNTVRHIANNPNEPCRVFGIGRVFRQETIDRTHLPEFHQIEGIIHEPDANLPMLISTLKTFYAKMGYPDVRVRPAYFPYTEPSVEVEVYWRGEWLELGGSGIFRPEVTEPLGTEWPVCAWGMGLERLAMLVLGLDDIRELYQPDLERLQDMPIL